MDGHQHKNQLLRFTTAGSVDNGKSTLIGRLLYDSKSIFEDQYAAVASVSRRKGNKNIDLALFTDGLRDEVELGITIDVAYRYFSTPKRRFIIADVPGHKEFTRNMVTGASTTHAMIVLVDVQQGITEQTKRHSYIASLLNMPKVIVCINKMDAVDWSQDKFQSIVDEYTALAEKLEMNVDSFIPTSALIGDNVVERSKQMPWYTGNALLERLETINIHEEKSAEELRLPIQFSLGNQPDEISYFGRVMSGRLSVGDRIMLLPSNEQNIIKTIDIGSESLSNAFAPMSIRFTLETNSSVGRGEILVHTSNQLQINRSFRSKLCWLADAPVDLGTTFTLLHTNQNIPVSIESVLHKIDVNSFETIQDSAPLQMNDICEAHISSMNDLLFDSFKSNRTMGSFILVDPDTNATVAAGMIL